MPSSLRIPLRSVVACLLLVLITPAQAARVDVPVYGHYILAVNHNANRHGQGHIQWQRIELTNLDTGRQDDLDPVSGDPAGTVLYVGRTHAGRYRVSSFKSVRGNIISTVSIGARAPGMEFEVKAGAVVDAGTLVAFQMGPLVATARIPSSPRVSAAGLEHLYARYRSLRGTSAVVSPFDEPSGQRVTGLVRMRPAWRGEPTTVDGLTLVPAKLGTLARHRAGEGWRSVATGSDQDLTAVARVGDQLLVGTETGEILGASTESGPFLVQPTPTGTGPVRAFLGLADGRALAVALRLDGVTVDGLQLLERAPGTTVWVQRETLPAKLDMPFVGATARGVVVQTHPGRFARLTTERDTWEETRSPLFLHSLQADGSLMALDHAPDVALSKHVRVHMSADLGTTWTMLPGVDDAGTRIRASAFATSDGQGGHRLLAKPLTGWLVQSDRFYRLPAGAQAWALDPEFRSSCRPRMQTVHWTDISLAAWWTVGDTLAEACADGQQTIR